VSSATHRRMAIFPGFVHHPDGLSLDPTDTAITGRPACGWCRAHRFQCAHHHCPAISASNHVLYSVSPWYICT
jgi:hypothetical protein